MTRRTLAALVLLLAGCGELGNPVATETASLVRTSESTIGRLVTEVRLVAPADVAPLITELGPALDHADATVPRGGQVVAVIVRPVSRGPRPPMIHLVTEFVLPGGLSERHVWVARGEHARFVAIFGSRATPIDVLTTTL